jgi:hypothetical protein
MAVSTTHSHTPFNNLTVISYNMHGFNQGFSTVTDLIASHAPDIFLLQEHWLTPDNLNKFDKLFTQYFSFGSSAMASCVEAGPLRGRPFGGTMTLTNNKLRPVTESIFRSERCTIVKVVDFIIINLYLPCVGTDNRLCICSNTLLEAWTIREQFSDCRCIIGGDLNTDLQSTCSMSKLLVDFFSDRNLMRCDELSPASTRFTYFNEPLNHYSAIDYFLPSDESRYKVWCSKLDNIIFALLYSVAYTYTCKPSIVLRAQPRNWCNYKRHCVNQRKYSIIEFASPHFRLSSVNQCYYHSNVISALFRV